MPISRNSLARSSYIILQLLQVKLFLDVSISTFDVAF